jgi:hypothetical protein
MLRTGQRAGEVFDMQWRDVDEAKGWWTIPGEKVKNKKTHRVPLTKAALALLAEARRATSRPGRLVDSGNDGLVFEGPEGGSYHSRAVKVVSKFREAGLITGDYIRHDFRRTVATGLQALSIPDSTITHVLNQSGGGSPVTQIYAHHHFDTEKKTALEAWGRHLDALLTGQPSARVVSVSAVDAPRHHLPDHSRSSTRPPQPHPHPSADLPRFLLPSADAESAQVRGRRRGGAAGERRGGCVFRRT